MPDTAPAAPAAPQAPAPPPAAPPAPSAAPAPPTPAAQPEPTATPSPTPTAAPEAPAAPPTPPPDPTYERYANLYATGQWQDQQQQPVPPQFDLSAVQQMLDQRLPQPATPAAPDPVDQAMAALANNDIRGFVNHLAEASRAGLKLPEPSTPFDEQRLYANVAQVVELRDQLAGIRTQARAAHPHLAPLESMIQQRAQAYWEQAQVQGRIKSDADVPAAYRAAVDTAIKEAQALYDSIRQTGQIAPNAVRTDVVAASPGSNVAERDTAPIGAQPTEADVNTSNYLEQRRRLQFSRKSGLALQRPVA